MRLGLTHGEERPRTTAAGRLPSASGTLTGRSGAWLFTLATAAVAVAVFVAFIVPAPAYEPDEQLPWPLFAVAFALAEAAVVHLMFRNQAVTVSLNEIPLVVGFYYLAPANLIIAQFIGAGVALVIVRRQPPLKIVFNLAIFSLGSSLAILVFQQVTQLAPTSLIVWYVASFAGTATVVVVSALAIAAVISIRQRRLELGALRGGIGFGLLMAVVNTSVALVAVVLLGTDIDHIWLLLAPAVVGLIAYRSFYAQRKRQARLEFLYDCAKILEGPVADDAILTSVLLRAREMFRAGSVEAVFTRISSGDSVATLMVVEDDAPPRVEVAEPGLVAARRAMLGVGDTGRLFEYGRPSGTTLVSPRDSMIVPLPGSGDLAGTLLVTDRLDDVAPFGSDDLRLLEELGSRLGLVVEKSGLIDRLATSLADVTSLAAIVQSSEDAIVAVDLSGHVVAWNTSAEHVFGDGSEVVLGRAASDVFSQVEHAPFRDGFSMVFGGVVHPTVLMDWVRADGTQLPISITLSPIRGSDNEVIGASASVRDETTRARAEAATAASADLLRTIIDGSPLGMGVAGPDHLWIQANAALSALLGIPSDDMIGRSTLEMIHPDDRKTIQRLEECLFDDDVAIRSIERRYLDRSGQVTIANVTARIIREPSSGEAVALYAVEDITVRRQTEEKARSGEERFRRAALTISAVQEPAKVLLAVLESAREALQAEYAAIATFSADSSDIDHFYVDGLDGDEMLKEMGRWPSGAGLLGLAARLGRPVRIRDLTSHPDFSGFPRSHPRMTSFLAVPIHQEGTEPATLYLANKIGDEEFSEGDETTAVALATHAAVCLANARINAQADGLMRDLDRANLELKQASEAKSRFLASVAHELRTPLHSILVAAELVNDPPAGRLSDGQVRDLGATIESSGRHMVHLIDDLVDLARIEAGRLELRPMNILLAQVIADLASSLGRSAEERGVALEFPAGPGPGPTVLADPVRLRQILTNLLVNAIKFTEPGGRVWLEVHATRTATRITVHDTGIGIAPEDLERAFLPFEQVSRTAIRGTGLGLTISRSLAELHGGQLDATSTPGLGSAFTLTLPGRPYVARRPPESATILPVAGVGEGRPILVVEDDPTAMELTSTMLRMAGYDVWQATGLAAADEELGRRTPALLLLDLRLGDGNGLDLVPRIRANVALRDLPVLAVSADAMPDDVARARAAGCTDFLSKPVSARILLARVHKLIEEAPEVVRPVPSPSDRSST